MEVKSMYSRKIFFLILFFGLSFGCSLKSAEVFLEHEDSKALSKALKEKKYQVLKAILDKFSPEDQRILINKVSLSTKKGLKNPDMYKCNLFMKALLAQDLEAIQIFLDRGAEVDKKITSYGSDDMYMYPLRIPIVQGNSEILKILLPYTERLNRFIIKDKERACITPLGLACSSFKPEIARILIENGASLNRGGQKQEKNMKSVPAYCFWVPGRYSQANPDAKYEYIAGDEGNIFGEIRQAVLEAAVGEYVKAREAELRKKALIEEALEVWQTQLRKNKRRKIDLEPVDSPPVVKPYFYSEPCAPRVVENPEKEWIPGPYIDPTLFYQ